MNQTGARVMKHAKILIVAYRKTRIFTYMIIFALRTRSVVRHGTRTRYTVAWRSTWQLTLNTSCIPLKPETKTKIKPLFWYNLVLVVYSPQAICVGNRIFTFVFVSVSYYWLHISGVFIIMLIRLYLLKRSSTIFTPWEALLHMGFMCWTCQNNENVHWLHVRESFSFG